MADQGVYLVDVLRNVASQSNVSAQVRKDWQVLEAWIGCTGPALSDEQMAKIRSAWLAYLAVGVAPTASLQGTFALVAESPNAPELAKQKPPTHIMDIFDRMLATDREIAQTRGAPFAVNKGDGQVRNTPVRNSFVRTMNGLSRNGRLFLVGSLAWAFWAYFRSTTGFEFIGIYFTQWDADSFLVNVFLPPALVIAGYQLAHWIRAGKQP